MTEPDRYGEEIRRALTAAAELVVPAGDGLDVIRRRAARRPRILAWLLAYVSYLPRQLATRVRVMASELAVMARGESDLPRRLLARLRLRAGRPRSAQAWLRPALAGAAALLLVVAVTFAVPNLRQQVINSANFGSNSPAGQSNPQLNGNGSRSPYASGSASRARSSRPGPTMTGGKQRGSRLYLQLPPWVSSSPSPSGTGCPTTPPPTTVPPAGPSGSPTPVSSGGGGADNPADVQNFGYSHAGSPNCTPSGSSSPTPPPPTSPPPTTPPPTTPPPTTPPPTSPPPSTSGAPTGGSTSAAPAISPSGS